MRIAKQQGRPHLKQSEQGPIARYEAWEPGPEGLVNQDLGFYSE